MKFRPLHDRVMIRRVASEGWTAGGIIMGIVEGPTVVKKKAA